MEQEQIDLIIRAAQVLQNKKEFFDYIDIILPIVTAILGWLASIWWQSRTFVNNTKKEHYYVARDKVEYIVENFNGFLEYIYTSYKSIKNNANLNKQLEEDFFNDFVTKYQFILASIHQKLKIIFPGRHFPINKITDEMKILEENILEMARIVSSQNSNVAAANICIEDLNKRNRASIENITNEVSIIENTIIEILNGKANELGIKE